jgi:hypothetical protein
VSPFEYRLRQEMHALAETIMPGDLRPLRRPSAGAWSACTRRWLAPASAMAAIALVTGAVMTARHELGALRTAHRSPAAFHVVPDPADIAVTSTANLIRVLTAAAGRIVKTLRMATEGNGFALAPDAKSMFVVGPSLTISQVVIATGEAKRIGTGAYPAVSPNSRYLAYAAGSAFTTVAIRDLRTGRTRSINLMSLIGTDSSLLNQGGLTWLGDGTQILAVSEPDAVPLVAKRGRPRGEHTACGQQTSRRGLCTIVINLASRKLFAHQVYVPSVAHPENLELISGDLAAKESFFIAQPGRSASVVDKVRLGARTPRVRTVIALPEHSLAVAMAPDGDRVLYVPPSSPTSVWIATVRHGGLTRERRLLADGGRFEFNLVAW